MKSAQVLSRFRSVSRENEDGNSQPQEDDDICSLNSWSDDIVFNNHTRNHPTTSPRRSQSLSLSSSGSYKDKEDLKCTGEQSIYDKKSKANVEDNIRTNKRGLAGSNRQGRMSHGGETNPASSSFGRMRSTSSSSSLTKTKATAALQRNPIGSIQDSDDASHSNFQSNFPLSLDLKSASFECPPLWDNPIPPSPPSQSSDSIMNDEFSVINGVRIPKPKDQSSPIVSDAQSQKLYPNLDELRVSESSDNHNISNHSNYSKPSPNRPQLFDYTRTNNFNAYKHRDSDGRISTTSSSVDPNIGLYPSLFASPGVRAQRAVDRDVSQMDADQQSLYFKSQPVISSKRPGFSMKPNNSSNDLESMNKHNWEHLLERENVKSKVMTVWNNIKYGWTFKPKSNIRLDSALFLLGKVYHKRSDVENEEPEFLEDFTSRIWLTYRSNFYPIPGTKFTTDCGWGCMLRTGQMLIAQCFITHFLGRDWRLHNHQNETQFLFYKEIVRWFSDPIEAPSDKIPFSLHNLVNFGRSYNKVPGEWYGPASVAYIFRDALRRASLSLPILKDVCIYVAQDCTVFIDDVNQLCRTRPKSESGGTETVDQVKTQHSSSGENLQNTAQCSSSHSTYNAPWCRSLIILIPVRLGGESMNEIYAPCIKSLLSYTHCMGIIGGKPKHSLYFVGWQDNKLIYLDPHYCREALDTTPKNFSIETFHCTSPRKLPINKMDPSCSIGFYIKDAEEFKKFVHDVTEFISPPKQKGLYPLFVFSNGSQKEADLVNGQIGEEQGRVKVKHYVCDENGQRHRAHTRESEEFIML